MFGFDNAYIAKSMPTGRTELPNVSKYDFAVIHLVRLIIEGINTVCV